MGDYVNADVLGLLCGNCSTKQAHPDNHVAKQWAGRYELLPPVTLRGELPFYDVDPGPPYVLDSLILVTGDSNITRIIEKSKRQRKPFSIQERMLPVWEKNFFRLPM